MKILNGTGPSKDKHQYRAQMAKTHLTRILIVIQKSNKYNTSNYKTQLDLDQDPNKRVVFTKHNNN